MQILLITSTLLEYSPINNLLTNNNLPSDFVHHHIANVGVPSTVYNLTKLLSQHKFDIAIQYGLAGTFSHKLPKGSVVNVVQDTFADIGIIKSGKFQTLFETNLSDKNLRPFNNGNLISENQPYQTLQNIPAVKGVTVNTVNRSKEYLDTLRFKFSPDVESMEGAAFFYVCMNENVPCIQIRGISNNVEDENHQQWNINETLSNIALTIDELIKELNH